MTTIVQPAPRSPVAMSWETDVAAWRDYQTAAGRPTTTTRMRCYHVDRAGLELGKAPHRVSLDDLTRWMAGKEWRPNTRRAYRASLRSFYGWAMATGRLSESPAHLLPPVTIPRAQPRPATEDAYRAALSVADDRVRLAVMLAGGCGLRRSEVAAARTDHVEQDLLGWSLWVRGKGGHERLVPMTSELARLVRTAPPGWLFPSPAGGHLTPHYLAKLVTACLPDGQTMHTLRHRCATVAYAATRDLRAVQELLGHAKPETTAIYTKVPGSAIREAMESAA